MTGTTATPPTAGPYGGESRPATCVICLAPTPWPTAVVLQIRSELVSEHNLTIDPALRARVEARGASVDIDHRICIDCYQSFADWFVRRVEEARGDRDA